MSSSEILDGPLAAALARWDATAPEAPFLFFRDARGHFRWWSFATALTSIRQPGLTGEKLPAKGVVVGPEAEVVLGGFLRGALASPMEVAPAGDLEYLGAGAERDVWISWRPLSHPIEAALARWAIFTGAVVLVEPGACLHPELFAWARPTMVTGTVEDLLGLADQIESLAPRFLRRRWFRQRGERLRLVLVEGGASAPELSRVSERWCALSLRFRPRVAAFADHTLL